LWIRGLRNPDRESGFTGLAGASKKILVARHFAGSLKELPGGVRLKEGTIPGIRIDLATRIAPAGRWTMPAAPAFNLLVRD